MKDMPEGLAQLFETAQQMQSKFQETQNELAEKEVEASAGGGMVKATANGKGLVTKIVIEKEVLDSQDPDMLQDLVKAAVNESLRKAQEMMKDELGKLAGGVDIPGLFGGGG